MKFVPSSSHFWECDLSSKNYVAEAGSHFLCRNKMIKPNRIWSLRFLLVFLGLAGLLVAVEVSLTGERPNYTLIRAGLYQGGYLKAPPPGTKAVLNLCRVADPYKVETHVWEPIKDTTPAPGIAWLKKQVRFIDEQRQAGKTVYVHCRNGVSRAGMVVVAYVMYKDRLPRDKALALVRTKRPITRPNLAFMERLLEWERVLEIGKK
jgi:protein-tyrosine phosphatase